MISNHNFKQIDKYPYKKFPRHFVPTGRARSGPFTPIRNS